MLVNDVVLFVLQKSSIPDIQAKPNFWQIFGIICFKKCRKSLCPKSGLRFRKTGELSEVFLKKNAENDDFWPFLGSFWSQIRSFQNACIHGRLTFFVQFYDVNTAVQCEMINCCVSKTGICGNRLLPSGVPFFSPNQIWSTSL